MTSELVLEDPMLVAMPAAIRWPGARRSTWTSCARSSGCSPPSAARARTRTSSAHACALAGFEPRVHFESEDYQALLGLTASGMGVTVIPALGVAERAGRGRRPPNRGDAPRGYIYAARRAGDHDPATEADASTRCASPGAA